MGAIYPSAGAQSVEITLRTGLYANWRAALRNLQRLLLGTTRTTARTRDAKRPDFTAPSGRWLYVTDSRYDGYQHLAPLQYQRASATSWFPAPRIYPNRRGPGGFLVAGAPLTLNRHGYAE